MVGISNIVDTAKRIGIDTPLEPNLSLALGSCAVPPMQMAAAYGTLARGGIVIQPWTIRHVDDLNGHVLETAGPIACRTMPETPVAQLVDIMQDVVTSGTGSLARLPDRPVAGKTGTADQGRDLWFIGFTPDMVTAVWGGNKMNEAIADKHVTGGSVMASVWHDFNVAYYKSSPTPAGELISIKAHATDKEESVAAPRAANPAAHIHATRREPAAPVTHSNPTNGTVTRDNNGVIDYRWHGLESDKHSAQPQQLNF
jgi:membrane peptidoglycan carboxypeptidase